MHKSNKNLWLIVLTGFIFIACGRDAGKKRMVDQIKNDVYYLAGDQLEGREAGTEGETWAAKYIINRFRQMGLAPMGTGGSWMQEFDFTVRKKTGDDSIAQKFKSKNVIGLINNKAANIVVIGAHYDHLGYGDDNSLYREGKEIHNGADDNASGTAVMMLLVEILKKRNKNNNYLFIAFSGEEKGLYGSNYFVKNPTIDLKNVTYMINLDMVGRMKDSALVIYGTGTSPVWNDVIDSIKHKNILIKKSESGVGPSDHTSFYLQDIPVLHFFTGQHEDYHKPSDDADKINYEGMYQVAGLIDSIITRLNDKPKLKFTRTRDQDSRQSPKFSVTLGVVPDYIFDGKGMRIDGISPDKPAEKAGLQKGDIVIQLGEIPVNDMMSYMEALGKFHKGDTTTATIVRNGKSMNFNIQF
ncbi:MAG TPA: M20/M25/M40 family metallo-hydrolase [Cyclobacteriaceae bacterium]|nr:M20/M25/M40 family metallo-hydrolase [Cyclobacteriaceae bacterium]